MAYKTHPLFYLLSLCIFSLYYYYYNHTVIEQTGLTIDSLWTIVKFVMMYGGAFTLAAFVFDSWRLKHSAALSFGIWFFVYLIMITFKNADFMRVYPEGGQCLIVPITVYPLIGISMLLGHCIGRVMWVFKDEEWKKAHG
ncbi:MAG: hypothetical protein V4805_02965 [Pseudomonadota bacterium]